MFTKPSYRKELPVTQHGRMRQGYITMELILISDSKLKITLTSDDMAQYELDCDTVDYDNTETRKAFWEILDRAKHITGFDAASDRVFIQLYPSRGGGCEMYVTKLGLLCAERREGAREDTRMRTGRGESERHALPHPLPQPRRDGERDRIGAYRFERMDSLLRVCRQLACVGYCDESSAYRDERDRYYLILRERASVFGTPCAEFTFITEFGTPENADTVRMYISEHGIPLCEGDAVGVLSRF